jgi:hypothetical protein
MGMRRLSLILLLAMACGDDDTRTEGTEPGDCSDGADNDADGDFDCDDSGCAGAPACDGMDGGPLDMGDDPADGGGEDGGGEDDGGAPDACMPDVEICNGVDDDCDGEVDDGCCEAETPLVDLLFVVDDSPDMAEAQATFVAEIPGLVAALNAGDLDADGTADFAPVDLHAGVVSTDMGSGGITVPTCSNAAFGDDGILQTSGSTEGSCASSYPAVLELAPSGDAGAAAADLQCVVVQGMSGCGFVQPLEAALKALTPSSSDLRFVEDTTGHADGSNDGFLRPSAIRVVLFVTTADDCTAEDLELYDLSDSSAYADTPPNLRCGLHPEALKTLSRFEDGLLATASEPSRLIYGALGGIPEDIDTESPATILADERMTPEASEDNPVRPAFACSGSSVDATPSPRMVELAGDLTDAGARTVTRSVCRDSYAEFVDAVLGELDDLLGLACE